MRNYTELSSEKGKHDNIPKRKQIGDLFERTINILWGTKNHFMFILYEAVCCLGFAMSRLVLVLFGNSEPDCHALFGKVSSCLMSSDFRTF